MTSRFQSRQWDYIVVGAGSAGCALVGELVKSGRTVLVIEAGGSDNSLFIKIPAAVWRIQPQHDWGYVSQPDPSRNGVVGDWHRGRVLGGTSSINGMIYVRGASEDFDRWAKLCGNQGGWSGLEVMRIFRSLERSDQPGSLRGLDGSLYVRTVERPHPLTKAFVEAAIAAGIPLNRDYNGASQEGVGYLQLTQRRGLRWSAADAFLKPILRKKNLKLLLHATVEKVEIQNGRAVAVVFQHNGERHRESARHIVLSAGALNSPKLLMLSGIGDPQEFESHGIAPAVMLPAVGRNLREHSLMQLNYRCKIPSYNLTEGILQKLAIAMKYLLWREGPIAAAYEAAGFLRTDPSQPIPDVQLFFAPIGWAAVNGKAALMRYPAFKVCIIRSHSVSSGRIRLASGDPHVPPSIDCRLLESESDIDTLVRGIETVRRIMRKEPIASLIEEEITPGPQINSVESLRQFVRNHAETTCHPIGTCRMGVGEDAVVGPDLRVRGIENLWIADASIMPDAISANTNAPCMMIGAKLGRQLAQVE